MMTPRAPQAADTSPPKVLVLGLSLATFVNMLGAMALGPFLPVVARDLGTSVALLGQVPALMMLFAAFLGLVAGPFADHSGYRRTLTLGLLTVVLGALATGLAPTYPLLLLVALVGAVGRAAVLPTAQSIVALRCREDGPRRRALSWVVMGQAGAPVIGVPLLTTIAAASHWRVAFFVLAGVTLGSLLLLRRLLDRDAAAPPTPFRPRRILEAYAPIRRHRPTLRLIGATLAGNTGLWAVWTYVAVFLVQRHGLDTREIGWVYLVTGAANILGGLLAGGRLGAHPRRLIVAGRLACGLALGIALALPLPLPVGVGLLALSLLLQSANTVSTAALLAAESPAGRATTLAFNSSAMSLGLGLGAALGGATLAVGDWTALGLCSLAWLAASAALAAWPRPRELATPAATPSPAGGAG